MKRMPLWPGDDAVVWFYTVLAVISYVCFLLIIRRKATKLPPGPSGLPLVGSLFRLGSKPHESLFRLSTQYGPLMTVRLGLQTTVVVSSANMAEEVLQKHDRAFAGRIVTDTLDVLDQPNRALIFNQNVPRWRAMRRICNTHLFTHKQMDAMRELRERKVRALVQHLRSKCVGRDGREEEGESAVDVGECIFATVLNLLSITVFSRDVVDLESISASYFKNLVWEIMVAAGKPNLANFFPVLKPVDPQGLRRQGKVLITRLYKLLEEVIGRRSTECGDCSEEDGEHQGKKSTRDFFGVLLELSDDPESGLDKECIMPLLSDLFAAGAETTTSTVEWAMAELLRHPDKMAKAKTELRSVVVDSRLVEESDIPQLPYLGAVVKETLRLHPPAPLLIPHRADFTTEIGGFTVPKNAQVLVNVWPIARDASYWDEPLAFLPERFLVSDVNYKGQHFQYLPFGSGRRMCPGLPLADRMIHLLLASLLHSFSWKLPGGIEPEDLDMESKIGITLQRATPLMLVPSDPVFRCQRDPQRTTWFGK